ncbi:MAG: hypothetical protein AXW14_06580 [Alteromonas sp. Nap_26]|nr:MAG: hypothetical protein AXW14_06580 [Alteromonas sp. Nap_26]
MENDKEDDFMCMRVGGGKTIATYKGVTVVASKRMDKAESQRKELVVKPLSWWRRLLKMLKLS